jgi:Holliday junction resolvase
MLDDLKIPDTLPTEAEEQERLVKALRAEGIAVFAVPNGGRRGKLEAIRMKRQGVAAGVPDLVLPGPDPRWRCLAIELKRQKGGRVAPEQEDWHRVLRSCGWKVLVCYGAADACAQLRALGVLG